MPKPHGGELVSWISKRSFSLWLHKCGRRPCKRPPNYAIWGFATLWRGGVAVGAHGYVRATADVNFLVSEEAFEPHGLLVTFKQGVPIEVGGIRIDYLSPAGLGDQLEETLDQPTNSGGIPIVPIEVLIYMKLVAKRRKDQLDVLELLRMGANVKRVESYLTQYAADLLPLWRELVAEAGE